MDIPQNYIAVLPLVFFLYDSVKKKRVGVITYQVSAIPFHEVQTPLSRLVRKQYL